MRFFSEGLLWIKNSLKEYYNHNTDPRIYFWRDQTGHEIDCILERGQKMFAVEIKAGKTITQDYFKGLSYWRVLSGAKATDNFVVYAGNQMQERKDGIVIGWQSIPEIMKNIYDYPEF